MPIFILQPDILLICNISYVQRQNSFFLLYPAITKSLLQTLKLPPPLQGCPQKQELTVNYFFNKLHQFCHFITERIRSPPLLTSFLYSGIYGLKMSFISLTRHSLSLSVDFFRIVPFSPGLKHPLIMKTKLSLQDRAHTHLNFLMIFSLILCMVSMNFMGELVSK